MDSLRKVGGKSQGLRAESRREKGREKPGLPSLSPETLVRRKKWGTLLGECGFVSLGCRKSTTHREAHTAEMNLLTLLGAGKSKIKMLAALGCRRLPSYCVLRWPFCTCVERDLRLPLLFVRPPIL